MAFLDGNGVLYLWQKIVNKFVAKETGKGLSEANFTTAEKTKLSSIEANANKTVVEDNLTSTSTTNALSARQGKVLDDKIKAINDNMADLGGGDMLRSVYDTDNDGKVDKANDSDKLGGKSYIEVSDEILMQAAMVSGQLAHGICDENGVIAPDSASVVSGDDNHLSLMATESYQAMILWVYGVTKRRAYLTFEAESDISPVDGKLPLKLLCGGSDLDTEELPIDISTNSPLKAGNTYTLVINCDNIASDAGVDFSRITGSIIGLDPDTDTEPTEGSNNFLTSGAVYTALEDTKEKVYETIDPWIESVGETMGEIAEIAEGKCKSYVFATVDELDTWLTDEGNTAKLKVGDVFLIQDVDVPDYWWDGTEKQILETTKADITAITNAEIDQIIGS